MEEPGQIWMEILVLSGQLVPCVTRITPRILLAAAYVYANSCCPFSWLSAIRNYLSVSLIHLHMKTALDWCSFYFETSTERGCFISWTFLHHFYRLLVCHQFMTNQIQVYHPPYSFCFQTSKVWQTTWVHFETSCCGQQGLMGSGE